MGFFVFLGFFAVFDKEANIHFSINGISRPISSHDHNSTDQAIEMDRHHSDFRKLGNFFSGKQQAAVKTDQKIYSFLIYDFFDDFFLSQDFKSGYITLVKVRLSLAQRKTNEK